MPKKKVADRNHSLVRTVLAAEHFITRYGDAFILC